MRFAVVLAAATAFAQPEVPGRVQYANYCADCHGATGEGARGPSLRRPNLSRAPDLQGMMMVIAGGIPNTAMPPTRITGNDLLELANFVLGLGRVAHEPVRGDVARGKAIYFGKGGCTRCHVLAGEGGRMGPELTAIGLSRGAAHLKQSLLEPAAEWPNRFAQYRIVVPFPDNFVYLRLQIAGGRTVEGIRLNEDPFTIQVRTLSDEVTSFSKRELTAIERLEGKSPMPSYRGLLTDPEVEDLVAWLLSLRGR